VASPLKPTTNQVDLLRGQVDEQIRQCEQKEKEHSQVVSTDRDYRIQSLAREDLMA
jgi:hypothetical protein